jgi:hypothetical protein
LACRTVPGPWRIQGCFVRSCLHACGEPGDAGTHGAEQIGNIGEGIDALQPELFGYLHVVQCDVRVLDHAQRHLAADGGHRDARGICFHEEGFDLAVGDIPGHDREVVGENSVADPAFFTADDPAVPAFAGGRC